PRAPGPSGPGLQPSAPYSQPDDNPEQRSRDHFDRRMTEQFAQALLAEPLVRDEQVVDQPIQDHRLLAGRPPDTGGVVHDNTGEDQADREERRLHPLET